MIGVLEEFLSCRPGFLFCIENPSSAKDVHMFTLPCWRAFILKHGLHLTEVTYCTFKLKVRKPTYILTNSKEIARALKPHYCGANGGNHREPHKDCAG